MIVSEQGVYDVVTYIIVHDVINGVNYGFRTDVLACGKTVNCCVRVQKKPPGR